MAVTELDYIHPELNTPVIAIGGNYVFTHEKRIIFKDRDVLYYLGIATFDTTCCGPGGCYYAYVPGFVVTWKIKKSTEGHPITKIELVKDLSNQKAIRALISENDIVNQVNFHL